MTFDPKNVADLYVQAAEIYRDRAAFATKQKDKIWKPITYFELYQEGISLATALIGLHVKTRDFVAVLSDNRVEWIKIDCACQLAGIVNVPRGSDVTLQEIEYILNHCEAKVLFVENQAVLEKVKAVKKHLKSVKHIILMDENDAPPRGILHLSDLIKKGRKKREKGNLEVEKITEQIKEDDLFTLIYTSGTTGNPKGVMLTHKNIISQIVRLKNAVDISPLDRFLSILPIWHILERMFEMYTILNGCCTYYTNIRSIAEDLREVRPTFLGSAPRLWESIYSKILTNVEKSHPVRRGLFHIAYFFSRLYKSSVHFLTFKKIDLKGRNIFLSMLLALFHAVKWVLVIPFYGLFNASVLERLRLAAGGDLKASISGGGSLPLHIDEFFNYIGIPVLEGYGMTETSPVIATRTSSNLVIGTVGPIFPDTQLRIIDLNNGDILYPNPMYMAEGRGLKGEIYVKGPQVMKGYYKDKKGTDEVLKDGWLNTGDIGIVTFNRCLKIIGRTKDTIVLRSGENVDPIRIEVKLLDSHLIDQVIVVGQDQKYLTALIVPSVHGFEKAGIDKALPFLAEDQKIIKMIAYEIKSYISLQHGFKQFELIQGFKLLSKPFEAGDELTSLFKLRRHVIVEKYSDFIKEMY
jgi:long-chain acyl-CoA synthetase